MIPYYTKWKTPSTPLNITYGLVYYKDENEDIDKLIEKLDSNELLHSLNIQKQLYIYLNIDDNLKSELNNKSFPEYKKVLNDIIDSNYKKDYHYEQYKHLVEMIKYRNKEELKNQILQFKSKSGGKMNKRKSKKTKNKRRKTYKKHNF